MRSYDDFAKRWPHVHPVPRTPILKWTCVRQAEYDPGSRGGSTTSRASFISEQTDAICSRIMQLRGEMRGRTTRDRRVRKTRGLLHEALMSLIAEKKYELITVQEVLDRADVGRSTFYTHFQDKDELLVTGFEHFKNRLASAQASSTAASGMSYERIIGFSLGMFKHVNEYRHVLRGLLGSNAETVVRRHLHSALIGVIQPEVKTQLRARNKAECPVSPELLTHFLASTYVSVLTSWLDSKNPVPPKGIDAAYRQLVLPCLASIFERQHVY